MDKGLEAQHVVRARYIQRVTGCGVKMGESRSNLISLNAGR
jgi:hypothetical protein